jgi:hypothetical protein
VDRKKFGDTTGRPDAAAGALSAALGPIVRPGVRAGGTITLDVPAGKQAEQHAWAAASWLVANAQTLGIVSVETSGSVWTATDSAKGWQHTTGGDSQGQSPVRFTVA